MPFDATKRFLVQNEGLRVNTAVTLVHCAHGLYTNAMLDCRQGICRAESLFLGCFTVWLWSSAGLKARPCMTMCLVTPLTLPVQAKLPEAAQRGVDLKGKLPSLQQVDGPIKAGRDHTTAPGLDDQGSPVQVSTSRYQHFPLTAQLRSQPGLLPFAALTTEETLSVSINLASQCTTAHTQLVMATAACASEM